MKEVEKKVVNEEAPAKVETHPARQGIEANKGYVRKSMGYPVQPGQTWRDLTPDQKRQWFTMLENKWKAKFMATNPDSNISWTRG